VRQRVIVRVTSKKRSGSVVRGEEAREAPIGRQEVMIALRAASRAVHVMELLSLLDREKSEKDAMRAVLEQLGALGMAKELPGNKFKYVAPRAGSARKILEQKRAEEERPPRPRAERNGPRQDEQAVAIEPPRPALRPGHAVGWLSMSTRGFGFVTCDDGGPDVFLPPPAVHGAMHGDRVEVRTRPSPKGRDGEVVQVLVRGLGRVAGKLVRARRALFVEPGDPRLPERFAVEGVLPLETPEGAEVVARITRYPDAPGIVPAVTVLRVLGARGTMHVEVEKVLIREGVAEEFPAPVIAEALGFPAHVPESEIARREDLRTIDLCTIDPEDARDHDDAVFCERTEQGYRAVVAIADVSHYVRPGSAIDVEAHGRGCSIYLPDRAIPMLPPELSTHLASLVAGEDRLTLAVECQLDRQGRLVRHRFVEGVMRSRARLTYGSVARALGWTEAGKADPEADARLPHLRVLAEVSGLLRARRTQRGALSFELPESKIVLTTGESGAREPSDVVRQKGDPGVKRAYEMIEDLMLLANETVGEELSRRGIAAPFRVHGRPDAARIAQFGAVAEAFGLQLPEDAGAHPKQLQSVLAEIAGTPHEGPLGYLLLRAMQQAVYAVENVGHFALAASDYVHFTSPIRRYPDLVVHRLVRALARGEAIERTTAAVNARRIEAIQSSRMERRAMNVERDAKSICAALVMTPRLGETIAGTVSGLSPELVQVTLDAPFVEVGVPLDRIEGGRRAWELDPLGIHVRAPGSGRSLGLGDGVKVKIERVSLADRRSFGAIVEITRSERPRPGKATRPAKGERPSKERPVRAKGEPARGRRTPAKAPRRGR
jgi:ribonuclease R